MRFLQLGLVVFALNSAFSSRVAAMDSRLNVAVLLYDGALLLDYGVAAEMFLAADFMEAFNVYTVSDDDVLDLTIVGKVKADYSLDEAPEADIVIVPGGMGWFTEAGNERTIAYLKSSLKNDAVLFAVCTGSLLLAKAGLLKSRKATTNIQGIKMLSQLDSSIQIVENQKFVDTGNILTTAGSGCAIEATLYLVEKVTGAPVAQDLALRYLDYHYKPSEKLKDL